MLTIEMGTPEYLPVMVKNPLSENSSKGWGLLSRNSAIVLALDGAPTVIFKVNVSIHV